MCSIPSHPGSSVALNRWQFLSPCSNLHFRTVSSLFICDKHLTFRRSWLCWFKVEGLCPQVQGFLRPKVGSPGGIGKLTRLTTAFAIPISSLSVFTTIWDPLPGCVCKHASLILSCRFLFLVLHWSLVTCVSCWVVFNCLSWLSHTHIFGESHLFC